MLQKIIDTHSHYDAEHFNEDRQEVIESLFNNGISAVIHASTDINSALFGLEMAEKYPNFYTSIGLHPENTDFITDDYLEKFEEIAKSSKKVVAVGEIGLDYHYEGYDKDLQIKIFKEQLELAKKLDLPVIVHCRDATADCLEILKEYKPRGVMHCYSGSVETAKELLELGMYISLTGVLTFKNSKKAVEVLKMLPRDRFMLETDCPYMSPEPLRGKRCDSSMLVHTAKKASEIWGVTYDELVAQTEQNAKTLFGI